MIQNLTGTLRAKGAGSLTLEVGGVGLKVQAAERLMRRLPALGAGLTLFTHLHVREDALELYGFMNQAELEFFELLLSVSGVGPKSALAILDVSELDNLTAAIQEGRPDLLTKAAGVGRKTAERVVLELKGRVVARQSGATVKKMETDTDLAETLTGLGYRREEAKAALEKIGAEVNDMEARLKAALKLLSKRN
jgi:Holliday junction DNA helicase RuvA